MKTALIAMALLMAGVAQADEYYTVPIYGVTDGVVSCAGVTNMCVGATNNYDTYSVEYMQERGAIERVVTQLALGGYICKVLGHAWENTPTITLGYDPNLIATRQCFICRKVERKRAEWK